MYQMTSNTKKYTHSSTLAELKEALTWLEQKLEIRTINTRINNYLKVLESPQSQEEYLLTKKEVDEFLIIYRAFKNESKDNILTQVKFIVSGGDYRQDSNPIKSDPARDYLHELSIAARLRLAGIQVETNSICDVVANYDNKKIYIECKRVRSDSKLLSRIKEANKQIVQRIGIKKSDAYGYITVDVTDLLQIGKNIEEYNSVEHLKDYSKKRLSTFSKKYGEKIRASVSKKVCAVVFYAHILGIVLNGENKQLYYIGVFYSLGTEGKNEVKLRLNLTFQPCFCQNIVTNDYAVND